MTSSLLRTSNWPPCCIDPSAQSIGCCTRIRCRCDDCSIILVAVSTRDRICERIRLLWCWWTMVSNHQHVIHLWCMIHHLCVYLLSFVGRSFLVTAANILWFGSLMIASYGDIHIVAIGFALGGLFVWGTDRLLPHEEFDTVKLLEDTVHMTGTSTHRRYRCITHVHMVIASDICDNG